MDGGKDNKWAEQEGSSMITAIVAISSVSWVSPMGTRKPAHMEHWTLSELKSSIYRMSLVRSRRRRLYSTKDMSDCDMGAVKPEAKCSCCMLKKVPVGCREKREPEAYTDRKRNNTPQHIMQRAKF